MYLEKWMGLSALCIYVFQFLFLSIDIWGHGLISGGSQNFGIRVYQRNVVSFSCYFLSLFLYLGAQKLDVDSELSGNTFLLFLQS